MASPKSAAAKETAQSDTERREVAPGSEISDLAVLIAGMNKVMSHLQSAVNSANASIHITDWLLLRSLAEENNLPMAQAARRIGVTRQRVHQQIESLKGAKLIEVESAEGKGKTISISKAGRELVQATENELKKALASAEGTMPTKELNGARRVIMRLGKAIISKPQPAQDEGSE